MEKREDIIDLFDIYQELLTQKQQTYFKSYYFLDMSLSEIALELNVSRNAVHDQIKKVLTILNTYEQNLKIDKKNKEILKLINDSEDEILLKIKNIIKE